MSVWQKVVPAVVALVIALIVLVPMFSDPRLSTLRSIDFLKMVGVGACLGAALTTIVIWSRA